MNNPRDEEHKQKMALAKVGLIALIDEATGYQDERFEEEGDPLNDMYEDFLENDHLGGCPACGVIEDYHVCAGYRT